LRKGNTGVCLVGLRPLLEYLVISS
jgi:hypothetical protein